MKSSRRILLKSLRLGATAAAARPDSATTTVASQPPALAHDLGLAAAQSARGIEGQRKADLSNGTYLNPIMAGDHPDPAVLKDGDDYYLTFPRSIPTRAS